MPRASHVLTLLIAAAVAWACGGGGSAGGGAATPASGGSSGAGGESASAGAPSGPPRAVDCGDFTSCAVTSDGGVRCWGKDKEGEIGDGGGSDRATSAPVPGLTGVKSVALASQFGCALLEGGKVKCWGTGRIANDGKSLTSARATEVAGVSGAEEIVASGAMACARTADGVVCWGADTATIGTPPKGSFRQIAVGFTHACALDGDGAVTCWGSGDWAPGGPLAKPPIKGAVHITTGDRHACVVMKDKSVQCWGTNDAGQLGIKPDIDAHKKPVTVPGVKGVTKLVSGEAATCAILEDGTARCWGANGEGELGLGRRSGDERPAQPTALPDSQNICLGSTHGCAMTKSAKIVCWGANAFGQLGDGKKDRRLEPAPITW